MSLRKPSTSALGIPVVKAATSAEFLIHIISLQQGVWKTNKQTGFL
jgi:hypothetical protein